MFLHAFTHKKIFDGITETKSKEFEKETVKNNFEKIGYQYIPNITDKRKSTLEIDGLAIKDNICYIVECKGWKLRPLIDDSKCIPSVCLPSCFMLSPLWLKYKVGSSTS